MRFGAGSGTPTVILVTGNNEENLWPELFESFTAERRVFVPDLPDTDKSFGPRLRAFVDGLGLSGATLIAPGSFAIPALEFALLEPDRLKRLVLIARGAEQEAVLIDALSSATPSKSIPVLVVRRDGSLDGAVEAVREFVARS